jgi:hypothetical protein
MRTIWIGRSVLALAALMFVRLGLAYLITPAKAVVESRIALTSPGAITSMRAVGTMFLVIAAVLCQCLPERRVSFGLGILATLAVALTATRLLGTYVDGADPFTSKVLWPELIISIVAIAALVIERWRTTEMTP